MSLLRSKSPKAPHLVTGKRGVAGEVADLRSDVIESFDELAKGGGVITCTNATRPAANTFEVGGQIWNTDDNAFNYSDGTNWRDGQGNLT